MISLKLRNFAMPNVNSFLNFFEFFEFFRIFARIFAKTGALFLAKFGVFASHRIFAKLAKFR